MEDIKIEQIELPPRIRGKEVPLPFGCVIDRKMV